MDDAKCVMSHLATSAVTIMPVVPATDVEGWYAKTMELGLAKRPSADCVWEIRGQKEIGMETSIHIGFDDIDSPRGGCTTHFASLMVEELERLGVRWIDYPNLVRLNPNVPFRTRGNGAVALRFSAEKQVLDSILPVIERTIPEYTERGYPNTNPGVVVLVGAVTSPVQNIAQLALWRVVPIALARRVLEKQRLYHLEQGNGRGLIGALAAIGNELLGDHTYEFLAYRSVRDSHRERGLDKDSVFEMDRRTRSTTFSNVDEESGSMLIEPHGPDPVIFGIRGESPQAVVSAAGQVNTGLRVERWMVVRTNQGTGEHLKHRVTISDLRPYMAASVAGTVSSTPHVIEGGHVVFSIRDETGSVDCAAYEPTGGFREFIQRLKPGDDILAYSGVRPASRTHGLTLNIEGVEVILAVPRTIYSNPLCPRCGHRMKSAGKTKGFKCVDCGFKDRAGTKMAVGSDEEMPLGVCLPPPRAQRHLTRPESRTGRVNRGLPGTLVHPWHSP